MNSKTEALLERIDRQMDILQDAYQELFQIKEMVLHLDEEVVDFTEMGFSYDISKDEYRLQVSGYYGYVVYTNGVKRMHDDYEFELYSPEGDYIDSWYLQDDEIVDLVTKVRHYLEVYLND